MSYMLPSAYSKIKSGQVDLLKDRIFAVPIYQELHEDSSRRKRNDLTIHSRGDCIVELINKTYMDGIFDADDIVFKSNRDQVYDSILIYSERIIGSDDISETVVRTNIAVVTDCNMSLGKGNDVNVIWNNDNDLDRGILNLKGTTIPYINKTK